MNETERRKNVHYHVELDVAPAGTKAYVYRAEKKIGPFLTLPIAQTHGEQLMAAAGEHEIQIAPVIESSGAVVLFVYRQVGETDRVQDMGVAKELAGNVVRGDVGRKYFIVPRASDLKWSAEAPAS